jgi:hypothetical protein
MARTRVFVSYSHDDREWLKRFSMHVSVLVRQGLVDLWSDSGIPAGAEWERQIESALTTAKVAVLLVSPAFLASEYIWKHEMPRILAHAKQGMEAIPLLLRPCAWRLEDELAKLQARPTDGAPLSLGSESSVDLNLSEFAYELAARIGKSPAAKVPASGVWVDPSPVPIATASLDLKGTWGGLYNRNRRMILVIQETAGDALQGLLEYPDEGTITIVEGAAHRHLSRGDPLWAQVGGASRDGDRLAISFRETGYKKKGSSAINFSGEYRVILEADDMIGAWFSEGRLVGTLALRRQG